MNILQGKTIPELLIWLDAEGATLAKDERDILISTHSGLRYMGSVQSTSSVSGEISILGYPICGSKEVCMAVSVADIASLEICNSRRLRPARAYQQMLEMERSAGIRHSIPDIDDTCP